MRLLLFSGSHSRHIYFHRQIIENFNVVGIIAMKREDQLPEVPGGATSHDKELFIHHFRKRYEVELNTYGNQDIEIFKNYAKTLFVNPNEFKTDLVAKFIKTINPDVVIIFGTDIIKEPILSMLPPWKINLHLGLSPWYRGSATLFWPFYFLQPQFTGATIHQILPEADAGDIIHQVIPKLSYGQGIHYVAANVVVQSSFEFLKILKILDQTNNLHMEKQKSSGRLFLTRDFNPHHLRVIYDLFNDRIVDAWLSGELGGKTPKIIDLFTPLTMKNLNP